MFHQTFWTAGFKQRLKQNSNSTHLIQWRLKKPYYSTDSKKKQNREKESPWGNRVWNVVGMLLQKSLLLSNSSILATQPKDENPFGPKQSDWEREREGLWENERYSVPTSWILCEALHGCSKLLGTMDFQNLLYRRRQLTDHRCAVYLFLSAMEVCSCTKVNVGSGYLVCIFTFLALRLIGAYGTF